MRTQNLLTVSAALAASLGVAAAHSAAPAPTAPPAAAPLTARPSSVWSLAFSPDGQTLAAGSYQRVRLIDVAARTVSSTLTGHAGAVRCLAWSSDGQFLAAGGGRPGEAGEVKVWRPGVKGGNPAPADTLQEHRDVVEGVAFSPAGDTLLSASVDEKILAVDLASRKVSHSMTDHTNRVVSVATSQNGKYIATGSLDKTAKIWSAVDFKPLANIDNTGGQVYTVSFLPPGDQVMVAGEDGNVRIFRLNESRTGKLVGLNANLVRTINGNRTPVLTAAVAAKGGLLAVGGADQTVRVIDGGNTKYTLKECPEPVYSLAFSPDGSILAAGCRDGKVRFWTMADGKLAGEL